MGQSGDTTSNAESCVSRGHGISRFQVNLYFYDIGAREQIVDCVICKTEFSVSLSVRNDARRGLLALAPGVGGCITAQHTVHNFANKFTMMMMGLVVGVHGTSTCTASTSSNIAHYHRHSNSDFSPYPSSRNSVFDSFDSFIQELLLRYYVLQYVVVWLH